MQLPGMSMPMPAHTVAMCFNGGDPRQSVTAATEHSNRKGNCRPADVKSEGDKITWQLECTGPHPMTGHGEMEYFGDHYSGQMVLDVAGAGTNMGIVDKVEGKYVGACQ